MFECKPIRSSLVRIVGPAGGFGRRSAFIFTQLGGYSQVSIAMVEGVRAAEGVGERKCMMIRFVFW